MFYSKQRLQVLLSYASEDKTDRKAEENFYTLTCSGHTETMQKIFRQKGLSLFRHKPIRLILIKDRSLMRF